VCPAWMHRVEWAIVSSVPLFVAMRSAICVSPSIERTGINSLRRGRHGNGFHRVAARRPGTRPPTAAKRRIASRSIEVRPSAMNCVWGSFTDGGPIPAIVEFRPRVPGCPRGRSPAVRKPVRGGAAHEVFCDFGRSRIAASKNLGEIFSVAWTRLTDRTSPRII